MFQNFTLHSSLLHLLQLVVTGFEVRVGRVQLLVAVRDLLPALLELRLQLPHAILLELERREVLELALRDPLSPPVRLRRRGERKSLERAR